MYYPTVTVLLEEFPITNGNMNEWTNYRRYPEFILTPNKNQRVINKNLKLYNPIEDPNKPLNYKTKNNLISIGNVLGLVHNNIQEKLENYYISNDGVDDLIRISTYQPSHLSEKLFVVAEGNNLTYFNISFHISGGLDTIINQWYEVIVYLSNIQRQYIQFIRHSSDTEYIIHLISISWPDQIFLSYLYLL